MDTPWALLIGMFVGCSATLGVVWPTIETLKTRNKRQALELEHQINLVIMWQRRADRWETMVTKLMRDPLTRPVAAPFGPDMVKRFLFLCHPDKHNNSAASRTATEYLMSLR